MDIRALQLHLKKNQGDVLFIVSGDDFYLKSEAERLIKNHFQSQETEIDLETYTAPQMDYDKCLDSLQMLSFFSSIKLVHIKDADKVNQNFLESIQQFYSQGNISGLVVILSFSKMDKRKKTIKALMDKGCLVEVKIPYDNQVEGWIKYIAAKEKLDLKSEAVSYLNFLVGPSLSEILKSVQKLKDVFGRDPVTRSDVQEFVSKNGEEDIFKICDFLGKGELTTAMLSLEHATKHGANSIMALSLFHRHFKIIEGILTEQEKFRQTRKSLSQKDMATKVGVPPYFLANYVSQARGWNVRKVKEVFSALEAADLSLKSTGLKDTTVFSGFFMEISRILGERKGLRTLSEALG